MGTRATPSFDTDTLRRAVEGRDPDSLLSLYTDDAEIRLVNRNAQPSHPKVITGRREIAEMLTDVYGRDMTHTLEACVVQGDRAAYSESCAYADGARVMSESMLTLRDGRISQQMIVEAWDE